MVERHRARLRRANLALPQGRFQDASRYYQLRMFFRAQARVGYLPAEALSGATTANLSHCAVVCEQRAAPRPGSAA